jgi:RNA polymerase sigma-70 factor (ECF subfamily)
MASSLTWTLPAGPAPELTAARRLDRAASPVRPMARDGETPLADLDETSLIEACLDNRAGAFDLIVERHRRTVYLLCYRFVGNHEDASDLSQDVFIRAYRGLRSFRGQSSIATWLYRIGVNVCLNRLAVKRPPSDPIENHSFADLRTESATDALLREERGARVRAAIAQLPPKQRAALILRTYHEMTHQEIAGALGSSVGAVKANFFHALASLKKLLADEQL